MERKQSLILKMVLMAGSLPRRALKLVYEWLDLHKEDLMDNWERLTNSKPAIKIDPLR